MSKKIIRFDPNASFMEETQNILHDVDLSHVEYDPMDDGSMPYMPHMPHNGNIYKQQNHNTVPIQKGFVDVNNIQNFSNQPTNQPNNKINPQYNRYLQESSQEPGLDYGHAAENIKKLSKVTDLFNNIDKSTGNSADTDLYAISIAIKTLRDAVKVLNDVDSWIPQQHSRHVQQLKKIGYPIVNALNMYTDKIEKMK